LDRKRSFVPPAPTHERGTLHLALGTPRARDHGMKRAIIVAIAAAIGVSTFGCRREAEPPRSGIVAPMGRHIEAGTKFTGTLNNDLSTLHSRAGDTFTITIDEPVLMSDGTTAFRPGTVLHGRVVSVGQPARLTIAIDGVHAAIIDANGYATVGLAEPGKAFDSEFTPPVGPQASFGGGPRSYEGDNALPLNYELTIPEGTRLELLITEPVAR
jgi:hypothetical protein